MMTVIEKRVIGQSRLSTLLVVIEAVQLALLKLVLVESRLILLMGNKGV